MLERIVRAFCFIVLLSAVPARAEEAANPELTALRKSYDTDIGPLLQRAQADYIQRLDALMRQLGGVGRIQEAAVVKGEIDRVRKGDPITKETTKAPDALANLRHGYESGLAASLRPLRQLYTQKFEALVRKLGAAGRIDDAALAQKDLDAMRKLASVEGTASGFSTMWKHPDKARAAAMIVKGEVTAIPGNTEKGFVIGHLAPRSVIYLQYVEGLWKGWGNIPTDSPDDPKAQGKDRSRVAIVDIPPNGRAHTLAVVPPGTKAEPFFFVTDRTVDNVVLRMNDNDGDFRKNPDKGVKYRLYIERQ